MPKYCQDLNTRGKEPERILNERVDRDMLQRLISSTDIDENIRKQLLYYYTQMKNESIKVKYFYSKNLENAGRLYAQGGSSLQSFKKEIRHALAKEIYHDIDMENAHPMLLMQYCKKNNIECPNLTNYVLNREETLKKIQEFHNITRDQAKKFLLKIQYLGSYSYEINGKKTTPPKEFPLVRAYKNELLHIAKRICEIEKEIFESVNKDKTKTNKEASTLSILCQILEKKCLDAMFEYFSSCGFEVGVLCFDGLMLKKTHKIEDIEAELIECMIYVESNTGYFVKLVEKPMDTKLSFEVPHISSFVSSDKEAQEKLFLIEGAEKFKYCQDIMYCYNEKTGMYDTQIQTVHNYLIKNKKYLYTVQEKTEKLVSYGESNTLMNAVIPFIKAAAVDNEWLQEKSESSKGYLLFKDGIYNMKTGKFTKGFDTNIVFFYRVPWNFPERDEEKIKKAYDLSFGKLFKDPEPMLAAISRALAGDVHLKKFYICPGESNSGKSKFADMLKYVFGKYVGTFNAENLAQTSKNNTKEESQLLRWALIAQYHRILISNEVKMKMALDGNAIKKQASGGDEQEARKNHKDEVNFTPHYTLFCLLNDHPTIEPYDQAVDNRLEYIGFPYVFVNKDKLAENPEVNKLEDTEIMKKIKTEEFVSGLIHLILDAYQKYKDNMPKFDQKLKEEYIGDNKQGTNTVETIKNHFTITGKDTDMISVYDMNIFRKKYCKNIGLKKFTDVLVKELKLEKDRKDSTRYWKGITKKKNENNIDIVDVDFLD